MIGPFLFSVKKNKLCARIMHVRSLGKILFFSLSIDQNRVPFDTHSKEKKR